MFLLYKCASDRKFRGEALLELTTSTVGFITEHPGEQVLILKRIRETKEVSVCVCLLVLA